MAATRSQQNARDSMSRASSEGRSASERRQEFTNDVVEYLTEYARQNPGYAALYCIGIGFVLGWKLKPW